MPRVSIGDAEIYYEEAGQGEPLLLVPGLSGQGSFWSQQVEAFKRDFRVIVHDHRGAGLPPAGGGWWPPGEVVASRIDAIVAFDRRRRLGEIGVPTLVVVAQDDMVTPKFYSDEPAKAIPGARYV